MGGVYGTHICVVVSKDLPALSQVSQQMSVHKFAVTSPCQVDLNADRLLHLLQLRVVQLCWLHGSDQIELDGALHVGSGSEFASAFSCATSWHVTIFTDNRS